METEKPHGAYLAELVEEFGAEEVASWGSHEEVGYTPDLFRVTLNGQVFHGERVQWGRGADEFVWTVYRGGSVDRYLNFTKGERVTSVGSYEAALELIHRDAAAGPSTYWSRQNGAWRAGTSRSNEVGTRTP